MVIIVKVCIERIGNDRIIVNPERCLHGKWLVYLAHSQCPEGLDLWGLSGNPIVPRSACWKVLHTGRNGLLSRDKARSQTSPDGWDGWSPPKAAFSSLSVADSWEK